MLEHLERNRWRYWPRNREEWKQRDLRVFLFYHLKLRCYVIVELKGGKFDSRDAGQMSAYLSAVDDQLRNKDDQPSIGIILCKTKDNVFAEYVLRNFNRPIGIAEFEVKLVEKLPKELKAGLPTVEEIEAELSAIPLADKKPVKKKSKKSPCEIHRLNRLKHELRGP